MLERLITLIQTMKHERCSRKYKTNVTRVRRSSEGWRVGGRFSYNRCTDNFPSIVESIPTLGNFTLEAASLGKTRPYNIEKDKPICHGGV